MMTMVRGSNPIWYEVDLTAHAFDDTFYMFVLDNEIPYAPLPTWKDPFGNVAWDNPIRFLANGTLPNNVYFDPDTVYRLEFRQGNTQSDPLIYLVENYVPGSSGNTPINETSFSTDNQVTNPQFALINFTSSLTLNSVSTQIINVAPGWFLNLTGTGNVTLTQVLLNSAVVNPTNASYALQIQLSGSWTNAYLSQRFTKNGVLWSNSFVSSMIMALSNPALQDISAILVDSQGNTLTTVLNTTPLTEEFNPYPGIGQIGASMDTDLPPTAYIEYQLLLPNNCNITLTSIQLISGDVQITYPYEQTTIERQIDQTFHYYQPQLNFKAIPSLLTGWDFPLNPAQFGASKTITTTPTYIWDQTIAASVAANIAVIREPTTGAFDATTSADNEAFYLLQYLTGAEAVKTTLSQLSVNLNAYSLIHPGVVAQVFLYYSSGGGTIPILPTTIGTVNNLGIFSLTPANNWTQIPQLNGHSNSATLSLTNTDPIDFGFVGFNGLANFGLSSAMNFAIVVTFKIPTSGTTIDINSISLVPGMIATRPAPQTQDEVLRECQFYYESSFNAGVPSATTLSSHWKAMNSLSVPLTTQAATYATPFSIDYLVAKKAAAPGCTLYSVNSGTAGNVYASLYYANGAGAFSTIPVETTVSSFWTQTASSKSATFVPGILTALAATNSSSNSNLYSSGGINFHYIIDGRLGSYS